MKFSTTTDVILGSIFYAVRTSKGVTTTEAAKAMGTTQSSYSRLENGNVQISFSTVVKFCDYAGISYASFMNMYDMCKSYLKDKMECEVVDSRQDNEIILFRVRTVAGMVLILASK